MKERDRQLELSKSLNSWDIFIAGVAVVVAASTLVSDLTGYFTFGIGFAIAIALAFIVNLLLGMSAADLSVAYPKSGGLYDFAKGIFGGRFGRFLGVFLGLTFYGAIAFAVSGETTAGALGLRALFHSNLPIELFVMAIGILGVIPNIFGLKTASWVNAILLIFMLGIRWLFGIIGFLGLGATGTWSFANLSQGVSLNWFGEGGIVTGGIALAFWALVGIEFVCFIAGEVDRPQKALPKGIILGLFVILVTSLVMGLGITGTQSLSAWQTLTASEVACAGDCPQLAVGDAMLGNTGYTLMALATVTATLGSIVVSYSTMPRILYSIAINGDFGVLSNFFSKLHPKYGTPVMATLFTFVLYSVLVLRSGEVVVWVYSAAYLWSILYIVFHVLALLNRRLKPKTSQAFPRSWFQPMTIVGIILTTLSIYYAFAGSHVEFGGRALLVMLVALGAAIFSLIM